MSLTFFLILALAAWRLASLMANEDGPWMIFKRFRGRAEQWCQQYKFCRELGLHELVTCEWCNSIWIGVGVTLLYLWSGKTMIYLTLPFALSTVAIIIKYVVEFLQTAQKFFEVRNTPREQSFNQAGDRFLAEEWPVSERTSRQV